MPMDKNYKDRKRAVMMMTMVVVIVVVEVEISTVISMTRLHLCKSPAILTSPKGGILATSTLPSC